MPLWVVRAACLLFVLLAGNPQASADDLADFNAAVENLSAHNRVAIGYLRTGNGDLASLEIDRLREGWTKFTERFSGKPPHAFDGNPLYPKIFTVVGVRLVGTDLMLKTGHFEAAQTGLNGIRTDLYDLRKASGILVLADCVRDANITMDALMAFDDRALDWGNAETGPTVTNKASSYGIELDRCDSIANEDIRKAPEFRRLIDGSKASLAQIPKAVTTRDADLLHRLLIELRSFDNLLAFRYG